MEPSSVPMDIRELDRAAWEGALGRRSMGTDGVAVALRTGPLGTLGREHRYRHTEKTLGIHLWRNRERKLATLCGCIGGGCRVDRHRQHRLVEELSRQAANNERFVRALAAGSGAPSAEPYVSHDSGRKKGRG